MSWCSARCWRRTSCSPMIRRCRCSIPAGARPRRGVYGVMRSMIGHGADARIRRPPMSIPRIAGASIRPSTWRHSGACCRLMAMLASGKLVEARTDASIQLAFCWAHARRPFYDFYTSTQSPLAAEVLARIAQALCDRGRDPRPSARVRQARSSAAKSAAGRGPARSGCKITCRACRAGPIWPKPCAMRCAIGTG